MPIYNLKLISRKEIAKNTLELSFEKPQNLTFIPGQYAGFTLINPKETDAGGITRRFSLLSSPHENHLSIATRFQNSAYKHALTQLKPGDEIKFAGPTGNFILHKEITIPAVFIAGGIGIAPFYSMINFVLQQKLSIHITLFYGNQNEDYAAYLQELSQLPLSYPHFKFVPVLANPDKKWTGETGFITDSLLKKYIPDLMSPIYYVCGSPAMVTNLQETLMEMDIAAEKIKVEDFPGY